MPNIRFHDTQISWNNIFLVSSQGIPLTIIIFLSQWSKTHLLTFAHVSKYYKSYFPTPQITCFTHMISEAAVLSFPSYSCSEYFLKWPW